MLNPQVVGRVSSIRSEFRTGDPFPHVCIDNFLLDSEAENLLRDFPPFDPERAKNEFGQVGPKCVWNDLQSISPNYRRLYGYLSSREFLDMVSDMTGIPDLQFDPHMYGGGTHENVSGAELDPHIDFNYDARTGYHRRLNLLIYLNREWSVDWGGAIELHSNPFGWFDGSDRVKTLNATFNRCVIFETSEKSWHGFRRIAVPSSGKTLSRKLISIYLYTKDRPVSEVAPPHGTFYVPYSVPESVKPGATLSGDDCQEILRLMRKRDSLLALSFATEKRLSEQYQQLLRYCESLEANCRPPVIGYARVKRGGAKGYYSDEWVAEAFEVRIEPLAPAKKIDIHGWIPDEQFADVVVDVFGKNALHRVSGGKFAIQCEADMHVNDEFTLRINTERVHDPVAVGDARSLGFVLDSIVVGS